MVAKVSSCVPHWHELSLDRHGDILPRPVSRLFSNSEPLNPSH